MDLVNDEDGYDPEADYEFTVGPMTPQEEQAAGAASPPASGEEDLVPQEDVW
jgi:hypothetical protein